MDYETHCKVCKKDVHCCIFKKDTGFTYVGIKDAEKIKKRIKKDYSYFLDYSPLPKKILTALKNDDPVLEGSLRFSQLDKEKRILRLKTKKDGRCIFLNDNGRCDIYSIRPNICKIFPFWAIRLTNGKLKVIEHDIAPRCLIIKSLNKKDKDIEKALPKKEISRIKKIAKDIVKEKTKYKKDIRCFAKYLA
jgi:Fe-S-cluster containining protein